MIQQDEFPYLFEEVVQQDCYHLREVPFQPDVVLDIGANVGVFTTYAAFLFPKAKVYSIEPNRRNRELLKKYTQHIPNVQAFPCVIGTGTIWHKSPEFTGPPYYEGGHQYLSHNQLGMSEEWLKSQPGYKSQHFVSVPLSFLVNTLTKPTDKVLAKIDIEGAENSIFNHEPSMAALRRLDYVAMEIHYGVDGTGPVYLKGNPTIRERLLSLSDTHECVLIPELNYFQATKRQTHD